MRQLSRTSNFAGAEVHRDDVIVSVFASRFYVAARHRRHEFHLDIRLIEYQYCPVKVVFSREKVKARGNNPSDEQANDDAAG